MGDTEQSRIAIVNWIECAKLAFADREACYGDPEFVDVPLLELLSDPYSEKRRALIDPERASEELRPGLFEVEQDIGNPFMKSLADIAQFELPGGAVEKGRADPAFKLGNVPRDRRGRQPHLPPGLGERPGLDNLCEQG